VCREIDSELAIEVGLQALKPADRERVGPEEPRRLEGSVDLDEQMTGSEPDAPRWDYAVAYDQRVWFIEVHPASSTGTIDEVVKKARWLRTKITSTSLPDRSEGLFWISTDRVTSHLSFSRRKRQLQVVGVFGPMRRLDLR